MGAFGKFILILGVVIFGFIFLSFVFNTSGTSTDFGILTRSGSGLFSNPSYSGGGGGGGDYVSQYQDSSNYNVST